jgi:DNA-binding MarR family transcriptional regulator
MAPGRSKSRGGGKREEILATLGQEARHFSTSVVLVHQALAERLGLTGGDHKYVDIIQRDGPLSAGELAERTGLTTGAITGVVDRLEKKGFVRREKDPNDRRRVIIRATVDPEKEREIGEEFRAVFGPAWRMMEGYTDEELELILRFMRGHAGAMEEILKGLRKRIENVEL